MTTPPKKHSMAANFILGGLSSCTATIIVHPIDVVKTRMQLSGEGGAQRAHKTAFHAIYNIATKEGLGYLYKGLSAAVLRQFTYGTVRFGLFQTSHDAVPKEYKGNMAINALLGMFAGAFGALAGTPADVALIRMSADGRLPVAERRGYTNVINALSRIFKDEGVAGLWKGVHPTVIRAMVLNAAQLGGYTYFKSKLLQTSYFAGKDFPTHATASMIAGFLCSFLSLPVDITKTRLQSMKPVDGVMPYKGMTDCFLAVIRKEGFFALWKGFTPYYLRLGPQTVLSLVILEQVKKRIVF